METHEGVLLHLLDDYIFVNGDKAGLAGHGRYGELDSICGSLIRGDQRGNPALRSKIPVYDINDAGRSGGVVLRLSAVTIRCAYGADVGSWNIPGGCNSRLGWCDAYANAPLEAPCAHDSDPYACNCCTKTRCNGQAVKPWRPQHMGAFLDFYARYGGHASCCGSGYNEVCGSSR